MKTTLRTDITVKEICDGFVYNELEGKGLFGLSGKLTIQPEYQRNYIYADSKIQNSNIKKWSAYVSGSANRQEFLERALDWVSKGDIDGYMSRHRLDKNITELKNYFTSVIDWVSTVFTDVESEMRGLEWGHF